MSRLKLNVKNFTGEFNSRYKIVPEVDKESFKLCYYLMFNGDWKYITTELEMISHHPTKQDCIEAVIKNAEKAWGLRLSKTILKIEPKEVA